MNSVFTFWSSGLWHHVFCYPENGGSVLIRKLGTHLLNNYSEDHNINLNPRGKLKSSHKKVVSLCWWYSVNVDVGTGK
jgi:hypothetical protein